jgi:hypothetical protein
MTQASNEYASNEQAPDADPSDAACSDGVDSTRRRDVDISEWRVLTDAQAKLEAELLGVNKAALIDALAAAAVSEVVVDFDGYGDSGQIEGISVRSGDKDVTMPESQVEYSEAVWGESEPHRAMVSLAVAVESLAYQVLGQTHYGWEINDGSFGDIVIDVAGRSIMLRYNERYAATENYTHTF